LKKRLIALACCAASTALAQLGGGYLGPAVLSSGATGVGERSGQQVDLRFYAGVNGVYDSSYNPTAVDSKGNLVTLSGLYGAEANIGVYGTHAWRTALLGIDYRGVFREYANDPTYSGIDQFLNIGYTYQQTRHLIYKFSGTAGILDNSLGGVSVEPAVTSANAVVNPGNQIFDARSYYLQGGVDVTYQQTARTSYTFGGQGFEVWRQSAYLVGVEGYNARGTVEHRLNKNTSVGFTYQRQHFDFPKAFGHADIDSGELFLGTNIGPRWKLTVRGGVYHAEVSGLQTVALNPVIAALLGTSSSVQAFYSESFSPSGQATLNRKFKDANLSISYGQSVVPGNGVYLTSKNQSGFAGYSYTGFRKLNLGISGGYQNLSSLGQGIPPYKIWHGGAGFTYALPWSLHLVARYDYLYQQIESDVYKHTGFRTTLGLTFSPGKVPLSLW
jgi:hypothetical protein